MVVIVIHEDTDRLFKVVVVSVVVGVFCTDVIVLDSFQHFCFVCYNNLVRVDTVCFYTGTVCCI